MKFRSWQFRLGVTLVILSAVIYAVHYLFFHDLHHILIYLVGDIAFVPVEVLLVTLIIHSLLTAREKRSRLGKLSMVIGAFFSEVGTDLLVHISDADENLELIRADLDALPPTDLQHLGGDIQRVYSRIVGEWFDHMRHLQDNYPYLFSLAVRTNPFDRSASPVVS